MRWDNRTFISWAVIVGALLALFVAYYFMIRTSGTYNRVGYPKLPVAGAVRGGR